MNTAVATHTVSPQNWPNNRALSRLPACQKAVEILDASRLIQLGARAGLVCQLTHIDKTTANRLYRQIHGRPSPSGQMPFTDAWYLKSDRRMLHAAVIWRLYNCLDQKDSKSPARLLIEVYETYQSICLEPLLSVIQVAFVPQLMEMGLWHECRCGRCATPYLTPLEDTEDECPGCKLHRRFRCQHCGEPAEGFRRGRRSASCSRCGALRVEVRKLNP